LNVWAANSVGIEMSVAFYIFVEETLRREVVVWALFQNEKAQNFQGEPYARRYGSVAT
jgi:hypothetical protein